MLQRRAIAAAQRASKEPAGRVLVCPLGTVGFSAQTRRALELRDREAIDGVLSGSGTRQDMAAVECITVCQLRLLQSAIDTPDAHQVEIEPLRELLAQLDAEVVPAVASILRRMAETGRIGCNGTERQALLMLANICEQTLDVLPRKMHADAYLWVMDHPTLEVQE